MIRRERKDCMRRLSEEILKLARDVQDIVLRAEIEFIEYNTADSDALLVSAHRHTKRAVETLEDAMLEMCIEHNRTV